MHLHAPLAVMAVKAITCPELLALLVQLDVLVVSTNLLLAVQMLIAYAQHVLLQWQIVQLVH
jgi:hypothetical protein